MNRAALKSITDLKALPGCALLMVLHGVLRGALAGSDIASVVFSPGGTASLGMLAATVTFGILRLMVFFWVPAVVVVRLTFMALERWNAKPAAAPEEG